MLVISSLRGVSEGVDTKEFFHFSDFEKECCRLAPEHGGDV